MSTKIGENEVFFAQSWFSWPNGRLLPIHTIHILKAIVPAVNLAYLDTLYVHPVIRPIFVTFWDWTGSISWNLVICWFPRKMSFSRTASSIQIWTKRNSSNQRQKKATFVSSVQYSMEVFKQLVKQDKSCICDIISYFQTKYFVHFQTFWQPPLARVGNNCHPGLLKIIKFGTKASFWSATTKLASYPQTPCSFWPLAFLVRGTISCPWSLVAVVRMFWGCFCSLVIFAFWLGYLRHFVTLAAETTLTIILPIDPLVVHLNDSCKIVKLSFWLWLSTILLREEPPRYCVTRAPLILQGS